MYRENCVYLYTCVQTHTHTHIYIHSPSAFWTREVPLQSTICDHQLNSAIIVQRSDSKREHTGWPHWTQVLGISLERLPKTRLNLRQVVAVEIRFQIQDLQSVARPLVYVWKFSNISLFREILCCKNLLKFVDVIQFCLKSDNNIEHFTFRPISVCQYTIGL